MANSEEFSPPKAILSVLILAFGVHLIYWLGAKTIRYARSLGNPLRNMEIVVVNNSKECSEALLTLRSHCSEYPVVGFDCEWETRRGMRQRVALLQLATNRKFCVLIRLCKFMMPKDLCDFLEDRNIIKVGVAPLIDALNLCQDFGVVTRKTLDLRFVADKAGYIPGGLAKLAKTLLNVELDKKWSYRRSLWQADVLDQDQIEYAAKDAVVAINIFLKLHLSQSDPFLRMYSVFFDVEFEQCYKLDFLWWSKASEKTLCCFQIAWNTYQRYILQFPDGTVFRIVAGPKAERLASLDSGVQISSKPFTVRLHCLPRIDEETKDILSFYFDW